MQGLSYRRAWAVLSLAVLSLAALWPATGFGATVTNTAIVRFADNIVASNTVSLLTVPPASPATVQFSQYAPGIPGSVPTMAGGSQCATAGGIFSPVPALFDGRGGPIATGAAVELLVAGQYHAGEPIFIQLADANRNLDPAVTESIELSIQSSEGDRELLRLQETGENTGIFVGAIQSIATPPALVPNDCRLSVRVASVLTVDYLDVFYPTDRVQGAALVDPFGVVFDSSTGVTVDGATVTIVDATTGLPATVFCDDGITRCPSRVISGDTAQGFPPGGFRFPLLAPGNYRVEVIPPGGYVGPSTVPLDRLQALRNPAGDPYALLADASFGRPFVLLAGPAVNFDVPLDPLASSLTLQKAASVFQASAGDHLQYRISIDNTNSAAAARNVVITDTLPFGLRYQAGSLRIDDRAAPDATVSADGRTLTIAAGSIPPNGSVDVSYVVLVGSGAARGPAINRATARADGGAFSNEGRAEVGIKPAFFGDRFTLIGRIVEGECGTPAEQLKGVAKVRVLLDDGTYNASDDNGMFHFEGVREGTRVVQLDLASVPPELEVVPCIRNSRFAGRSYSQFVEARGGALWRTDFYLRPRPPMQSPVGIRLVSEAGAPTVGRDERYTLDTAFESLSATLTPEMQTTIESLAANLRGKTVTSIEITGHTDGQAIRARSRKLFADNEALSLARAHTVAEALQRLLGIPPAELKPALSGAGPSVPLASNETEIGRRQNRRVEVRVSTQQLAVPLHYRLELDGGAVPVGNLRATLVLPDGVTLKPGSVRIDGVAAPDPQLDEGIATFRLGASTGAFKRVIEVDALPLPSATACGEAKATISFDAGTSKNLRTPLVKSALHCSGIESDTPNGEQARPVAVVAIEAPARSEPTPAITARSESERAETMASAKVEVLMPKAQVYQRPPVLEERAAGGYGIDWLTGAKPGVEWLYPPADHNPRAPAVRVAIKHGPQQSVRLSLNGAPVSPLNYEGMEKSADLSLAISQWTGVDLADGESRLKAEIVTAEGQVVQTLERVLHFGGSPARVELVPGQSLLVADGIRRPTVAVRFFDAENRPVRFGVKGSFKLDSPYVSAQYEDYTKKRALAGLDQFKPFYTIGTDDGIAYIELVPTTESGEVVLRFNFGDERRDRLQEVRTWLTSESRDWVVVGFGEGTVGYSALKGNIEALPEGAKDEGLYTDGRVSLYAKGKIKGDWLMTMAYDSDKPREALRRESLRQVIDPEEFYTLYGDGSEQRYDASSQDKLYLKLERPQFYALFGDYDTGLTNSLLARYSRSLNGIKSEYSGDKLSYSAFAAQTSQSYARDEIAGDGTSGLYRLSRPNLVINSDTVRIETRDRFRSENIVQTASLTRHLDYDIDYANGTIFFRRPIPNRDTDFNPVFIVAEYETRSRGGEQTNAGGRVALTLLDGKVTAGVSALHDANTLGQTDLAGVDVKVKLGDITELRLEGARSKGDLLSGDQDGGAHVAELEHRGERLDALLYSRRQDAGFGVLQQNASEAGTQKTGADVRYRVTDTVSVEAQAFRQENLRSDLTRDVGAAEVRYENAVGGVSLGAQAASDTDATGEQFQSQQLTAGVFRRFFDNKLELEGRSALSIGDQNESIDYPTRHLLQAGYQVTESAKLIVAQEITDGAAFNSNTTRIGGQVVPWQGAKLDSTYNQQSSEYRPRTFGVLGLSQSMLFGERWSVDVTLDRSQTFRGSGEAPPQFNVIQPLASGSLNDDFTAVTTGATYRAELWSVNSRIEFRDGESSDRLGISTGFLREARAGVAFSALTRVFRSNVASGGAGTLGQLDLSWAWRPLGARYSILNKLELEYGTATNGGGFGFGLGGGFDTGDAQQQEIDPARPAAPALAVGSNIKSRKVINNLNINRVSRAWTAEDRSGNLLQLNQRSQWSLYYGSKYVWDSFDGTAYQGYTDLTAFEWRFDVTPRVDLGLQASVLHSWEAKDFLFSVGPQVGFTPAENAWCSVGYNLIGFRDQDFDQAQYTAEGPYLKLRFKFDQNTRLTGPDRQPPNVRGWNDAPAPTGAAP